MCFFHRIIQPTFTGREIKDLELPPYEVVLRLSITSRIIQFRWTQPSRYQKGAKKRTGNQRLLRRIER